MACVVVGAGVGEQGGDDAGCVLSERCPDGDLVRFLVVEGVDVERDEQGLLDPVGCVGQDPGGGGEFVEQGGVVVRDGGGLEGVAFSFGPGAFGVQLGVAGADAGAVGLGGGVGGVGGLFELGDQAAFGGADAGQLGAQVGLARFPG